MMQIVIDIPEREYKTICENNYVAVCACTNLLSNAIKSGTPLPNGHGRLIDADKLCVEDLGIANGVTEGNIDNAPTVIEADKEE